MIREAIRTLVDGKDLGEDLARGALDTIMRGEATEAQIGAFLAALRLKGETVEEVTGLARAMRAAAVRVPTRSEGLIDLCGTGGDGAGTFNISTAATFVVAGAGVPVAKHGNRAASSRCGGADVLEAIGVALDLAPAAVGAAIDAIGVGFLFARQLHPAMKHVARARTDLGVRTAFNILGPLTNPAGARRQLLGVFDGRFAERMAQALKNLDAEAVWIVHGEDGLDEISISGPTRVVELRDGEIRSFRIRPEDAGLGSAPRAAIAGGDAAANAATLRRLLAGERGPIRDVVVLNAAAGLVVADRAKDLREGREMAEAAIDSGAAAGKLDALSAWRA
ncbi:MAG: anthranilate phosphoribosyltransferase [Planctomycetes bacterium]|nr:anthranilate phosphoribosyltransferase [Planctomycetota bacterium]